MTTCKFCGDENVIPLSPLFAEMKDGKPVVFKWYRCNICSLEFKLEDEDATREYEYDKR